MQLQGLRIAITGATGFLGRYLVDTLAKRGAHPIAVVRSPDKAARVLGPNVPVRAADLADRAALVRAFAEVDAVISNAAVISFRSPRETLRTNVDGTRNVFEAIGEAGVRRAIAISSSAAYVPAWWPRALDEDAPLRPLRRAGFANAYGVSKAEAERIAWQLAREAGVALTSFRPCGITGPHDPLLLAAIARIARIPVAPFPAFTQIGVVHAADVADAVARALERPETTEGRAYNLQGNTVTLWQLADAWRNVGGTSTRLRLPVPCPISLRYDDSRARRELGWEPRSIHAIVEEAVHARRSS
ncbi:MAG: NAD(P)-dependent oxidoreductase [Polyangiales bacterium]